MSLAKQIFFATDPAVPPKTVAIMAGNGKLSTFDISNTSNLAFYNTITRAFENKSIKASAKNSVVYTGMRNQDGVESFDISNPALPVLLDSISGNAAQFDRVESIALDDENDVLYASMSTGQEVTSVDVSNPSNLTPLSSVNLGFSAWGSALDVGRQVLFVANQSGGVGSVNVSNPSSMSLLQSYTNANLQVTRYMAYNANQQLVFVNGGSSGVFSVVAVDAANPSSLAIADVLTDASDNYRYAISFAVDEDRSLLFVGTSDTISTRITVVDTSNKTAMSLVSVYQNATKLDKVFSLEYDPISKTLFATSQDDNLLLALDATNPSGLSLIDDIAMASSVYGAIALL